MKITTNPVLNKSITFMIDNAEIILRIDAGLIILYRFDQLLQLLLIHTPLPNIKF